MICKRIRNHYPVEKTQKQEEALAKGVFLWQKKKRNMKK